MALTRSGHTGDIIVLHLVADDIDTRPTDLPATRWHDFISFSCGGLRWKCMRYRGICLRR
jgi:hypothetical protein